LFDTHHKEMQGTIFCSSRYDMVQVDQAIQEMHQLLI